MAVIPWINARLNDENGREAARNNRSGHFEPLFGLTLLLQEIEQAPNRNLMLMHAPRSAVFTSTEEGSYLFREGRHVPFASFAHAGWLTSVSFRYNDPLDPNSGCRRSFLLLTGWQGCAELIASAIKHSSYWKRLETIEVTPGVYDVWATPRRSMWFDAGEQHGRQVHVLFRQNQAVVVARFDVDPESEKVAYMQLFPQTRTCIKASQPESRHVAHATMPELQPPVVADLSDTWVTRYTPHDEFRLNWK